jgi:Zn-dependent protease with chaperone function
MSEYALLSTAEYSRCQHWVDGVPGIEDENKYEDEDEDEEDDPAQGYVDEYFSDHPEIKQRIKHLVSTLWPTERDYETKVVCQRAKRGGYIF